jgi:hypothetical protein
MEMGFHLEIKLKVGKVAKIVKVIAIRLEIRLKKLKADKVIKVVKAIANLLVARILKVIYLKSLEIPVKLMAKKAQQLVEFEL